jgi:hypothetical protein
MLNRSLLTAMAMSVSALFAASCSSSNNPPASSANQTPPTNGADVVTWLATGDYKSWHCEPTVHAARGPSIHGFNRICSNDVIANNATATGPWPEGAAAVKELYTAQTDTKPGGYSVYLKTKADSAAGASWYYYEQLPGQTTTFADGFGTSGNSLMFCVACHGASGSDAAHTPSPNGHDFVYTPVH